MSTSNRPASPDNSKSTTILVDINEAARQLCVSVRKVRYLVKDNRLKVRRIDSCLRFRMADLIAFANKDQQ